MPGLLSIAIPSHSCSADSALLNVQGERKDVVFLSTEHYMFCVLAWDTDKGMPSLEWLQCFHVQSLPRELPASYCATRFPAAQ